MKKVPLLTLILYIFSSVVLSQSLSLKPLGVSDRDMDSSRVDATFDRPYNGLLNVGTETKMYFKGVFKDSLFTSPTWTLLEKPTSSTATVGTPITVDSATQHLAFIPDVAGTYRLALNEGTYGDTLVINAGTYLGMGAEDGNCGLCHGDKVSAWEGTGHSDMFERGMTGVLSSHYASYCIGCHTTGYDTKAANDGFDDRSQTVSYLNKDTTFVYPDSTALTDHYDSPDSSGHLFEAVWDSLFTFFPNSMELANIQCESCHGPGSAHNGVTSDNKMVATLGADNCAVCHDAGTHHVYPEQWDISGHANPTTYPATRSYCQPCHNGAGFVQFAKGESYNVPEPVPFTCAVCHDPHDATNGHQLRRTEVTLSNGLEVVEGGYGKLCMNCHMGRREAQSYTDAPHSHYGPHYATQADMLNATNAITFGRRLPSSPHLSAVENSCTDCHMYPGHVDDNNNVIMVGSHTFEMHDPAGVDNVKTCGDCHGDVGDSFSNKKYFLNGFADHDKDGTEEGVQGEVDGLLAKLSTMLPSAEGHDAYDPHDNPDSTWTRTELKAAFNYDYVYYDGSYGIHNPAFTVALLKTSIRALENKVIKGQIVAIDDVPNDQGKQVKIIWGKFAGDGIAVDPIDSYTVKRFDKYDSTWVGVGEYTADGSWRYALVVPTLFDSTIVMGDHLTKFKVVAISQTGMVFESPIAAGRSIDNLIPHAPLNMTVMVANGNVDISWEASDDPDINYYRVYRSNIPDFIADEATLVTTTVEMTYFDEALADGNYYYKVAAVDFSGNMGDLSKEVQAELSIDGEILPLRYALEQNYPNPFNPVTRIDFSIPEQGMVTLIVYNSLGKEVKTLIHKFMDPGNHRFLFTADDMSSGLYIYVLQVNDFTSTKKMILLK